MTQPRASDSVQRFKPVDFKTRFAALDGVRALAIIAVFATHYGGGAHGGPILNVLNQIRSVGWMGVDLFFVLSGFLITGILYDTQADSRFFKRFFARRSLRIFPVFYLTLGVLAILTPIVGYVWQWNQLWFVVYLGNFFANANFSLYGLDALKHPGAQATMGHFWSLCVEEQFYLLWPLVIWKIRGRIPLIWTAVGISIFAFLTRVWMGTHFPPDFADLWVIRSLPFRADSLLIGAIMALLLRGPQADRWQRSAKWVGLGALIPLVVVFLLTSDPHSPWRDTIGLTLIALASAGIIGSTLREGSIPFRIFHWAPLRFIGKYSYGFYVYHLIFDRAWTMFLAMFVDFFHSRAIGGSLALLINFATTLLVAKLSYDLIERRFLVLKRHFEYDSEIQEHHHAFRA